QVAGNWVTSTGESHAFLYSDGVMTDLGTLTPEVDAQADVRAINNSGQVVGNAIALGGRGYRPHAYLYSDGVMTDLGTIGEEQSGAMVTNEGGQVVGVSQITPED